MININNFKKLKISKIIIVILLLIFTYISRNSIIDTYSREVDLNIEKTIIINSNKNNEKNYKIFGKRSKDNFSNQIDTLLGIILLGFIVLLKNENQVNEIKNNSEKN